jgi:hypothetical protein
MVEEQEQEQGDQEFRDKGWARENLMKLEEEEEEE